MRNILLCAVLALPLVSTAAESVVDTPALVFSELQDNEYDEPDPVALQVVSATFGSTTVTTQYWERHSSVQSLDFGSRNDYWLSMKLAPKKGFRITGFSFSADVEGGVGTGTVPADLADYVTYIQPASAGNGASVRLPGGSNDAALSASIGDVNGQSGFTFSRYDLSIVDATTFEFSTDVFAFAVPGEYLYTLPGGGESVSGSLGAYGAITLTNPMLTIHTEKMLPVPEPAMWGMLLVGIGLTGVARRRLAH